MAIDAAGDVIVAGMFEGTIDLGGGPLVSVGGDDLFVTRLGADGAHVASRRFGDLHEQMPTAIRVDAEDRPIVTGYSRGRVDFGCLPLTSPTTGSGGGAPSYSYGAFLARLPP